MSRLRTTFCSLTFCSSAALCATSGTPLTQDTPPCVRAEALLRQPRHQVGFILSRISATALLPHYDPIVVTRHRTCIDSVYHISYSHEELAACACIWPTECNWIIVVDIVSVERIVQAMNRRPLFAERWLGQRSYSRVHSPEENAVLWGLRECLVKILARAESQSMPSQVSMASLITDGATLSKSSEFSTCTVRENTAEHQRFSNASLSKTIFLQHWRLDDAQLKQKHVVVCAGVPVQRSARMRTFDTENQRER
jgi:phosphopantetheinyl transferase (holo-ACP synthase)